MYYSICYMVCNYGGIFYGFLIPHIPIAPVHLYSMASMNDLCLYVSLFVLFRVNSYIWHIMFQCDEFIKFGLVWFAVRVVFPTAMFLHMPMALVGDLCQYVSYVMVHVNCYMSDVLSTSIMLRLWIWFVLVFNDVYHTSMECRKNPLFYFYYDYDEICLISVSGYAA